MHDISKTKRWMTGEDNARSLEFGVKCIQTDGGEVFQSAAPYESRVREGLCSTNSNLVDIIVKE